MKLNDELMKLFRTITLYAWSLADDDAENDTNMYVYYTNDLINYLATGDETVSTITNAESEDPDNDYTKVKSMMFNTIELINDFKEKMEQIDNKANKKSII